MAKHTYYQDTKCRYCRQTVEFYVYDKTGNRLPYERPTVEPPADPKFRKYALYRTPDLREFVRLITPSEPFIEGTEYWVIPHIAVCPRRQSRTPVGGGRSAVDF